MFCVLCLCLAAWFKIIDDDDSRKFDDDDINREIRNMFVRTNALRRQFVNRFCVLFYVVLVLVYLLSGSVC